jgi:hypothetical protein
MAKHTYKLCPCVLYNTEIMAIMFMAIFIKEIPQHKSFFCQLIYSNGSVGDHCLDLINYMKKNLKNLF